MHQKYAFVWREKPNEHTYSITVDHLRANTSPKGKDKHTCQKKLPFSAAHKMRKCIAHLASSHLRKEETRRRETDGSDRRQAERVRASEFRPCQTSLQVWVVEERRMREWKEGGKGKKKIKQLGFHTANVAARSCIAQFSHSSLAPVGNMLIRDADWRERGLKGN